MKSAQDSAENCPSNAISDTAIAQPKIMMSDAMPVGKSQLLGFTLVLIRNRSKKGNAGLTILPLTENRNGLAGNFLGAWLAKSPINLAYRG